MRRAGLLVAALCAALLPAACGGADEPAGPRRVPAPAGVQVEVLQYRSDVVAHRFQLKVRNGGTAPLTVLGVRLASSRFAAEAVWAGQAAGERYEIRPGEATDLPVPAPAARCDPAAGATDDARLDFRLPDGGTGSATLRVADPFQLLGRLREDECRLAGVRRIAEVSVQPLRVQGTGRSARAFLVLRIVPTGAAGSVSLETVEPTTLLAPPPGTVQWDLGGRVVSRSGGGGDVPLEIRPARCDPHAVAEDKLGTVLRIAVSFSAGDATEGLTPGRIEIAAPVAVRNAVYAWVGQVCGNA